MNWKIVVLGGLAYYVSIFIVSLATGQILHNGILVPAYLATPEFWRPELNEQPPNIMALMPMWVFNGLVGAFVVAAIFSWVRPAFGRAGWLQGLSYGVALSAFTATVVLGLSGVFNLPGEIWFWWSVEMTLFFIVGCTVLGVVAEKLAPEE